MKKQLIVAYVYVPFGTNSVHKFHHSRIGGKLSVSLYHLGLPEGRIDSKYEGQQNNDNYTLQRICHTAPPLFSGWQRFR
ncbi:hypothetical protein D3C73_1154400 [compost metagenome]